MFAGAKLALLLDGAVLAYLRDDLGHIPFPGHWDLPGGGREGDETAEACVLRELAEEFGLHLTPDRLIWRRAYASAHLPGQGAVFFAGHLRREELGRIAFGSEGQHWQMMAVDAFLAHPWAVPSLQLRLAEFLHQGIGPAGSPALG
ncbi:MAG: hypothetical protein RLZZ528_2008 [Pseudomonadota bacterium]